MQVPVQLQGMLGNKALLVVDGTPKSVAAGETWRGIKVLATTPDTATVEIDGKRQLLRLGEAPGRAGTSEAGRSTSIVLSASSGGHFMTQGSINGRSLAFMVDTGATNVAIGASQARAMGIEVKGAPTGMSNTANGPTPYWLVKFSTVRIGDVEVRDVEGVVLPTAMPYALLANSFLARFQMTRDNDQMVLERRY